MRVFPRFSCLLLILFAFPLFLRAAPVDPPLRQTDETALRALVETFYAHWAHQELDAYCALWSAQSALLSRRREALKKEWDAGEKNEITKLDILRVKIEAGTAEVRVDLMVRSTRGEKVLTETQHRLLAAGAEANMWRVRREVSAEENLAVSLTESRTEAERAALWAANADLINENLATALFEEAARAESQQDYPRTLLAQRSAQDVGTRLGNKTLVARSLDLLGSVLCAQGDYLNALQSYQESLKLVEAAKYPPGIFGVLNNLGLVYTDLGDYDSAIATFERSLQLLGDSKNSSLNIVLTNLANAYTSQGNYAKALHYLNQSIELGKTLRNPIRQAISLNTLARLYVEQGDERLAEDCYRQALALRKDTKPDASLADLLGNYGIWLARKGRYEEAHSYYQRALDIIPAKDRTRNARIRQNIGNLYRRQQQYDLAQQAYETALALREAANSKEGTSFTLHSLVVLYGDQGRYEQAMGLLERALTLAREVRNPELLWREYDSAGKLYTLLKKPQEARRAFDEAIKIIETLRTQVVGGEQQQEQFFENRISPYQGVMNLLLTQQSTAEALAYAERAKARVLLDVLRSGRADIAKALTPAERDKEKAGQNELASLNTQLYRASLLRQPDTAQIAALNARLQQARTNQEALQTTLFAMHPELKVQRGQTPKFDLPQVAKTLLDPQTALLEYVVLEDKTYLFALTQGATKETGCELKLYELAIGRDKLNETVEAFRRQLAQHELTFAPSAAQLYNQFLKPAATQLKGKTKLIIVRDAGLWELPFQALKNEAGRFMIEDFAISYAPSLMALTEMTKLQSTRKVAAPSVLAFGNPAFHPVGNAPEQLKDGFTPLPSSETEVNQLAKLYGTAQSKIYVGAEAREDRLKAEAGQASVLHLATHGILNNASPLYSQIVLAQPDEKSHEDGLLEAWEVMKLDLQAQVVILSACETGRGRIGAGEGVIGLTWAFFVAGAPATVVSQWKVDAESTSELMQEFHRHLQARQGAVKAEALRAAALKLLENPKYRHPFFWASFSLIGDGQ